MQLPGNPSNSDPLQFDYDTISDVIIHIRYTAREGGELLKSVAKANLNAQIDAAQTVGSVRLFSLRHEFPTEWTRFKNVKIEGETSNAEITFKIRNEHFPYWSKSRLESINEIVFYTKNSTGIVTQNPSSSEVEIFTQKPDGNSTKETLPTPQTIALPNPPDKFTLKFKLNFNDNSMEDLWLALTWGKKTD